MKFIKLDSSSTKERKHCKSLLKEAVWGSEEAQEEGPLGSNLGCATKGTNFLFPQGFCLLKIQVRMIRALPALKFHDLL